MTTNYFLPGMSESDDDVGPVLADEPLGLLPDRLDLRGEAQRAVRVRDVLRRRRHVADHPDFLT